MHLYIIFIFEGECALIETIGGPKLCHLRLVKLFSPEGELTERDTQLKGDVASKLFTENEIVEVASRTWPGVNKPGGVGRVIRVGEDNTYDVNYILGGREKGVEARYITSVNFFDRSAGNKRDTLGRCK